MNRGFTTLELMIVLVVAGLGLAASWGNFASLMRQHRLSAAANSLATDLRLARERAVAEGNDYIVTFRTGPNDYQVWDDEGSDSVMGGGDTRVNRAMPVRTTLQNPSFFGANRVIFHADGTCNASGAVEVTNGEFTRQVSVLASTGKISIN